MKRIILAIFLFLSVISLTNSCKAQDYIDWVGTTQQYEPIKYGALYNWLAATDAREIAASGWHVPTNSEFNTLITYLGDPSVAGGYLKEIGISRWVSPNNGATNSSLFTGVGGGLRFDSYGFFLLGESGYYWSSTQYSATLAYGMQLGNTTTLAFIFSGDGAKSAGMSLRLIKDFTTLTNGQTGTYIGNDGKVYRTICIGTQEWLADNLAETKYRNGDWITGYDGGTYTPISNATWAASTTGMMCFYNDDINNK